ncbi:MAG: hypothetical protein PHU63_01400 [Candidatus ainarchaeum sp.]|nr:hypothetical protein [Candidatus ainarchaeum sp.]
MKDVKQKEYKSSEPALNKEVGADLAENIEKFKDPVILGELVYKLLEERENTNRILKTLLRRIEELQNSLQQKKYETIEEERMLPKIDEEIMNAIKELGKVTAADIQNRFKYKGKNAASARLNRLYSLSLLDKKQVGRTVYFLPK